MQEHYSGYGKTGRLSPYQIRKMKENMRKVPEIQKRAEAYHQSESSAIEQELENYLQEQEIQKSNKQTPKTETKI